MTAKRLRFLDDSTGSGSAVFVCTLPYSALVEERGVLLIGTLDMTLQPIAEEVQHLYGQTQSPLVKLSPEIIHFASEVVVLLFVFPGIGIAILCRESFL
jgi:hypothetical protein